MLVLTWGGPDGGRGQGIYTSIGKKVLRMRQVCCVSG